KAGLEKCASQPTLMAVSLSTNGAAPPLPISPTSTVSLGLYSIWPLPILTSSLLSTELLSACINQVNMITIV
uniref:Uncharacterized protein n=1 Tax=Solanum lycopersicum TaxID=4081 RepID=A0A3Q7GLA1_SOLLC